MKRLQALAAAGYLAPIDLELGGLFARRAAATLPDVDQVRVVALAGALLSAERGRGNSCVDLASIAGRVHGDDAVGVMMPDIETCREVLRRSGLCTDGAGRAPLVLDGDRLYLYRFHAAERRLAAAVRARVAVEPESAAAIDQETAVLFRTVFDVQPGRPTDWQAVAAATAMRNRLSVITGGPGTGKTYTVARVLALMLSRDPTLRIAITAPTGKAAARLAESLRAGAAELPVTDALRAALPREGRTLHRLLGYQPWDDRFAHGPDRPLVEDVIVVDEASMVDLLMMDTLFAAARPAARIILLGDQDQLASVETGYVLGDICRAAEAHGEASGVEFAAWFERLAGRPLGAIGEVPPLRDAVVRLRRSWRFEQRPGIGALADAIRRGSAEEAAQVLLSPEHPDVTLHAPLRRASELIAPIEAPIASYLASSTPEEALERLGRFRVLSALREGRFGVTGLNEAIERWLREGGVHTRAPWYHLRPVLVTANDPATGLYNGDVGVTFRRDGHPQVYFPMRDGLRAFAAARVPAHVTAWAMTVHKSQGSEFDQVLLVLPDGDSPVVTRELLYTGVTRARSSVTVYATPDAVRAAVGRATSRGSGLAGRLIE